MNAVSVDVVAGLGVEGAQRVVEKTEDTLMLEAAVALVDRVLDVAPNLGVAQRCRCVIGTPETGKSAAVSNQTTKRRGKNQLCSTRSRCACDDIHATLITSSNARWHLAANYPILPIDAAAPALIARKLRSRVCDKTLYRTSQGIPATVDRH